MDSAYYDEITGRLRGLFIRLSDRLPAQDQALVGEAIDANELGLALEQIADVMSEDEQPLSPDEHSDMLDLADRMQMGKVTACSERSSSVQSSDTTARGVERTR